ncbi:hypothetical protein A3860_07320 [Niastella vici]|uniref:Glycosyltransferase 2-like domain-containing protein n=1 Tax=Niastella vici TaxID=1703345 RepID=A0A1V9FID5_9BACT|nr:glycosyltransferase [Niastella vici]OQP58128.1 hypothetical protein A3860_07320 [Niastella vici]
MIAVCIPVFNRNITALATALSSQMTALNKDGEILIMDDGSDASWQAINASIAHLPFVRYVPGTKNHGRIRIRQLLAQNARFNWLVFLDGDSLLLSPRFLQNYFDELSDTPCVVPGGRIYSQTPPPDCTCRLHWKYGTVREAPNTANRNRKPYAGFMSNNFLVHKSIFNQLQFHDSFTGYGHEDTWIGIQLETLQVPVKYIDNAVEHDGVEATAVFLAKTVNALQNLARLQKLVPVAQLKAHVRLYAFYYTLKTYRLLWLPRLLQTLMGLYIKTNLHSCNPSLFLFDVYRLHQFIDMQQAGSDL